MDLSGKTFLITGAAGGLGGAIALECAAGGAGLVMMESSKVDPVGSGTLRDVGLWDDRFIAPLRRVTDFVHGFGAAIGIQLGHSGRKSRSSLPWEGRGPLTDEEAAQAPWNWDVWARATCRMTRAIRCHGH